MKNTFGRRGQVALEGLLIILFILASVFAIMSEVTRETSLIETIYRGRVIAQEVAYNLSMRGEITRVIRVDENPAPNLGTVDVTMVSDNCREVSRRLRYYSDRILLVSCKDTYYTELNPSTS
jgi:hypothetical protein